MNIKSAFAACQMAADSYAPRAQLALKLATYVGPEIDQWLDGLAAWMVISVLDNYEDFTLLTDEGQRMFLCLAGEVLFGSNADADLRAECYRIATEPL